LGGVEFNADDLEEAFKAGFTAGIDLGCNCQHDKATP